MNDSMPWWKAAWVGITLREKLLIALAIAAVLYAIFKQPETKVTVIKEKVTTDDKKGSSHAAAKEAFNLKGLAGSTLHVNADGSYDVIGPFELSASKSSESSSEWHDTHKEVDKEKTITEPAQSWRVLVKGSALVSPDFKWPPKVSWSVGGAAHIGHISIFKFKIDLGIGGEYFQDAITHRPTLGPMLVATF